MWKRGNETVSLEAVYSNGHFRAVEVNQLKLVIEFIIKLLLKYKVYVRIFPTKFIFQNKFL